MKPATRSESGTLSNTTRPVSKVCRGSILVGMKRRNERRERMPGGPGPERRASTRFSLNLELRYTVSGRRARVEAGYGHTIDLSSSGLKLDVAIHWPVLLDGGVPLQLIAAGVVIWSKGTETAMRIERHELRTGRVGPKVVPPRESAG